MTARGPVEALRPLYRASAHMRTKIPAPTAALPSRAETGLFALGTVTVLLASACAASHVVETQSDAANTVGNTTSSSGTAGKAGWGSRIVLDGPSHGEKVAVTLTKVVPFAPSPANTWGPPVSARFYAVQFRLTNIGSDPYANWPSNAQVVDTKGRSYDFHISTGVPSCHSFMPSEQTIAPGSSALGCLARAIPKHAAITRVRFTFPSGDTGQWNVG